MMRNWTGAALFAIGAWLVYSALAHRRRIVADLRHGGPRQAITANSSLTALGDIFRPLVIIGVVYFAIKVTLAYILLDGDRIFSLFDLSGLLCLLAAYAVWLTVKTKYREAVVSAVPRRPQEASPAAKPSIAEAALDLSRARSKPREPELVS
jgi:hypothetical protein